MLKMLKIFLTLENIFKILYKGIKNDFYFPTISFKNNIIAGAIFLK